MEDACPCLLATAAQGVGSAITYASVFADGRPWAWPRGRRWNGALQPAPLADAATMKLPRPRARQTGQSAIYVGWVTKLQVLANEICRRRQDPLTDRVIGRNVGTASRR